LRRYHRCTWRSDMPGARRVRHNGIPNHPRGHTRTKLLGNLNIVVSTRTPVLPAHENEMDTVSGSNSQERTRTPPHHHNHHHNHHQHHHRCCCRLRRDISTRHALVHGLQGRIMTGQLGLFVRLAKHARRNGEKHKSVASTRVSTHMSQHDSIMHTHRSAA
jgi:hypothetical protein